MTKSRAIVSTDGKLLTIDEIWSNIPQSLRPEPKDELGASNELAFGYSHFGEMVTQMVCALKQKEYF